MLSPQIYHFGDCPSAFFGVSKHAHKYDTYTCLCHGHSLLLKSQTRGSHFDPLKVKSFIQLIFLQLLLYIGSS